MIAPVDWRWATGVGGYPVGGWERGVGVLVEYSGALSASIFGLCYGYRTVLHVCLAATRIGEHLLGYFTCCSACSHTSIIVRAASGNAVVYVFRDPF